jgi:Arc/MetJ-type ribon-helix-helix transcriptional regulator
MPSLNPTIAVRLDPQMFEKIKQLAERDGRSMSNFVEFHLRRLLDANLKPVFSPAQLADVKAQARKAPRQVDLAEAIADAVKRGPSKSAKHK